MSLRTLTLLCSVLATAIASGGADAQQQDRWRQDLAPLVPPVFPLPPNSQLNPGHVGGSQTPYTTAPLTQSPTQPVQDPTPGLKLTFPSR